MTGFADFVLCVCTSCTMPLQSFCTVRFTAVLNIILLLNLPGLRDYSMRKDKPVWRFAKSNEKKSRFESYLTDAILLAALSVAGYSCAFMYEYGYARHFGIPIYFVSPDYSVIAGALSGLGLMLILLVQIFNFTSIIFRDVGLPKLRTRLYLLITFFALIFSFYGFSLRAVGLYITCALIVIGTYLFAFLGSSGSIDERLEHAEKYNDPLESDIVTNKLSKIGPWSLILYSVVIYAPVISMAAGAGSARFQTDYHLIKELPGYALLKRDGDNYLAIRYDKVRGKVSEEFLVIKNDELKRMTLVNEKIGPLDCAICLR